VTYRRRELWLLLFIAASLGVGLAVREFRAGFPDLAERLEGVDADIPRGADPKPGTPGEPRPSRPPKLLAPPAEADRRLDLNRATPADLARLPGIGPALAQRIVDTRERQGRFASPDELRRVPGIGQKKLEAIRGLVTVGD